MTTVYRKYQVEEDIWKRIVEANKLVLSIDIKGKEYVQVNQRIKAFRFLYPKGKIETKIISLEGEIGKRVCLVKCEIYDDLGNFLSCDYAEEKEDSTFINKTSFIENAITSATGRAIATACAIGVDTSIASYEEVSNAIANQEKKDEPKPTSLKLHQFYLLYTEEEITKILDHYKVSGADELPRKVVDEYIKNRKDKLQDAEAKDYEDKKAKPLVDDGNNPFY